MFLAIDIGNTSTKFGLFKEEEPFEMVFHFTTSSILSSEHIEDDLLPKLVALGDLSSIIIASVVPLGTDAIKNILLRSHKEAKITVLKNQDIPIVNTYKKPDQVGIDRLLSSLAAYSKWGKEVKKPTIVIGFGTATTIDCINSDGEYLGGIIALGIEASAKYLSQVAAQLPEIDLTFPNHILGQTTSESIQSGILYGSLSMIEGLIVELHDEVFSNQDVIVVATGGFSKLFENKTKVIDHITPNLVLEGIAISAFNK